MDLINEFAYVEVEVDYSANGPRLKIYSRDFERSIYLDPLMLTFMALLDDKELFELIKHIIKEKYEKQQASISLQQETT